MAHVSFIALGGGGRLSLTDSDVVTVVAGLLETFGALPYDDNFQETYKKAWDLHKLIQKGCLGGNEGKVCLTFAL